MTTNKKVKIGDVNLDNSYFDPRNQKIRITTFIDGDVLQWLKAEAQRQGPNVGYQTYLNTFLRENMEGPSPSDHEKLWKQLTQRLEKMQKDLIREQEQFESRIEKRLKKRV